MREICDKHFPDNWVVPVYGEILFDLEVFWAQFPAAFKALRNNIVEDRIRYYAENCQNSLNRCNK